MSQPTIHEVGSLLYEIIEIAKGEGFPVKAARKAEVALTILALVNRAIEEEWSSERFASEVALVVDVGAVR